MKKSDFWFDLPEDLIAQTPIEPRDASRVMLMDRETGVNYLFRANGYAGGMTPLLDREGKPIITTVLEEKE